MLCTVNNETTQYLICNHFQILDAPSVAEVLLKPLFQKLRLITDLALGSLKLMPKKTEKIQLQYPFYPILL